MSKWICVDDICIPSDENDWEELVAFADAIAEQEPIDMVPCSSGTWVERDHISYCSECGKSAITESNFCPNCGVRMRGVKR